MLQPGTRGVSPRTGVQLKKGGGWLTVCLLAVRILSLADLIVKQDEDTSVKYGF